MERERRPADDQDMQDRDMGSTSGMDDQSNSTIGGAMGDVADPDMGSAMDDTAISSIDTTTGAVDNIMDDTDSGGILGGAMDGGMADATSGARGADSGSMGGGDATSMGGSGDEAER